MTIAYHTPNNTISPCSANLARACCSLSGTYEAKATVSWLSLLSIPPIHRFAWPIAASPGSCGANNDNQVRPLWPSFGGDSLKKTIGNANYNALKATVHYTDKHLQFLANYTYSKCVDNSSSLGEEVIATNLSYRWALCSYDLRHNF